MQCQPMTRQMACDSQLSPMASSSTSSQVEQQRVKGRGKVEWNTGEGEMSANAVGVS